MAERKKKVKETVNEEALNESIQSQDSEDVKAVFETKLNELLEMAKKKKNVIEDTEIIDHFKDCKGIELNTERMTMIFEYLEAHNVDVLNITADDDDEEPDEPIEDPDTGVVEIEDEDAGGGSFLAGDLLAGYGPVGPHADIPQHGANRKAGIHIIIRHKRTQSQKLRNLF